MSLRVPPLREAHAERGARFTDFGGWEMPVTFDSIRDEHAAVRERAGKFDVSHMGEVVVSGPDATVLMDGLLTNDLTRLDPGDALYAAVAREDGVMLDDTVVYRFTDSEDGHPRYLFVPNAGHDDEMTARWRDARDDRGLEATVDDRTDDRGMVAVQGPKARELALKAVADADEGTVRDLSRFEGVGATVAGARCWVARTGYTGEDGFEVVTHVEDVEAVWNALDCQPCGLGARDTLRLEAGFLLSGQDFHPEENPRTPYEAGVGFAVKLDGEFVGRDALERQHEEGVEQKLVGLRLVDRGVPRHGYPIETPAGESVGTVTSGTMSPTLGYPIAMGYVTVDHAESETSLRVVVRDEPKKAKVVSTPFLDG
jgi:aminomethyltransferase